MSKGECIKTGYCPQFFPVLPLSPVLPVHYRYILDSSSHWSLGSADAEDWSSTGTNSLE